MKKKPFVFWSTIGKAPFKVQINRPEGMIVTGMCDQSYHYRFSRAIPVKFGDVFSAVRGKGLKLNGKLVHRNIIQPKKKMDIKMGWAPKYLRLAVFKDNDEPHSGWIAADTRGYWVAQGKTPHDAMFSLIATIKFTEKMAEEDRRKGHKVIRWHVEHTKGTRKELLDMERRARLNGFILEGVDWRKSEFSRDKK